MGSHALYLGYAHKGRGSPMVITFRPHYYIDFYVEGIGWCQQNAHGLVAAIRWLAYFDRTAGRVTKVNFYGRG